MVAYSFQPRFVEPIQTRSKRQTIRALRARHARPGERLQLYYGMRTRGCYKIVPDPVCIGVDDIRIDLSPLAHHPHPVDAADLEAAAALVSIEINGMSVATADRDALAIADGFDCHVWRGTTMIVSPWAAMIAFWMSTYGAAVFTGVLIRWEDR